VWAIFFYLPYAFYMSSFQYDANHQAPDGFMFTVLSFVVVGGNATMYLICGIVSENCGFHYEEQRESSYMVFYCIAVFLNVMLDMVMTGWVSYRAMVGAGAHTFGGKLLSELTTVQDIFESYPIQKTMGYQLFAYSMPATFLTPFVIEPIALILLPFHLMKLVIRTNPYLKTWRAEKAMSIFVPMDSGRYADIIINVMLAALTLFVPGGWILYIYGGLAASHVYIYIYDHYRVLRCVPGFQYACATIDKFALKLVGIPLGFILVATLDKANCMADGVFCMKGTRLFMFLLESFIVHCILHIIAVKVLIPKFGRRDNPRSDVPYADAAKVTGATWFSTNPAYCLRSKYFYKHEPPVQMFLRGKEHLMQPNPEVGQHFKDQPAISEF